MNKSRSFALVSLLLSIVATVAVAQAAATVALRWVAPTTHTDGTAITAALSYNVYAAAKGATKAKVGTVTAGVTTTLSNRPVGECYAVTAVENGVGESAQSAEVCLTAPPNSPTGLVTVSVVVQ